MAKLRRRREAINKLDLKALRYTCENGTDLLLELPEGHIWQGGEEASKMVLSSMLIFLPKKFSLLRSTMV